MWKSSNNHLAFKIIFNNHPRPQALKKLSKRLHVLTPNFVIEDKLIDVTNPAPIKRPASPSE